jgi:hypothetical protein
MKVKSIDTAAYLTTTFLDPSPERFKPEEPPLSERRIQLAYICENCGVEIGIDEMDMKKHFNSDFSNLREADNALIRQYVNNPGIPTNSCLDFYCPSCNQATKILFNGGVWGRGEFGFAIESVLVIEE